MSKKGVNIQFLSRLQKDSRSSVKEPGLKLWLKFFYDNGVSVEKKRETAGISYKDDGSYRRFLEI